MVLKRRPDATTAANADSGVAGSEAKKPNIKQRIDYLETILPGSVAESMALPDAMLDDDLREAFPAIAALIGHTEYNLNTATTLYCAVDKESGTTRLYPPSLKAFDDTACIIWGEHRIILPVDTSISGDLYRSFRSETDYFLFVDISGYCFPIRIPMDREKAKDPNFQLQFATFGTVAQLAPHLQRGEPLQKWSEIPEGTTVLVYDATPVYDREEGKTHEVKYGIGLGCIEGSESPIRFYMPGDWADWTGIDWAVLENPIALVKKDRTTIHVPSQQKDLEIKSGVSFTKVSELVIGHTYSITGYKIERGGKYGDKVVFYAKSPEGADLAINGNAYMNNRILKAAIEPVISDQQPATFIVNGVSDTRDGKKKANCVLTLPEDTANPFLQRMAQLASGVKIPA